MEKLHFKWKCLASPQRAIWKKPEGTVGVVREVFQRIRQRFFRSLEGLLSEIARELSDKGGVKRSTLVGRCPKAAWKPKHNRYSGRAHHDATATNPWFFAHRVFQNRLVPRPCYLP